MNLNQMMKEISEEIAADLKTGVKPSKPKIDKKTIDEVLEHMLSASEVPRKLQSIATYGKGQRILNEDDIRRALSDYFAQLTPPTEGNE